MWYICLFDLFICFQFGAVWLITFSACSCNPFLIGTNPNATVVNTGSGGWGEGGGDPAMISYNLSASPLPITQSTLVFVDT